MSGIQGAYTVVSLFGRPYVGIKNHANKLTKLLLEQNDTDSNTLAAGETWDMGDGYSLKINSVDVGASPPQAWIAFYKNDNELDAMVIANGSVYTYWEKRAGGESDVPIFVTYADNISASGIRLKYTWLISDNIMELMGGDTVGLLRVISTEPLTLENTDNTITLSQGSTVNIADGLRFRVNNTPALQYYPEITVITGTSASVSQTTEQLVSGYNLIAISLIPDPPIYASNLLYTATGGIPGVTKVVRWNPTVQQWEGYEYVVADGIYLGNNFAIEGNKAYFIKGNASTTGQTYTFKGRR